MLQSSVSDYEPVRSVINAYKGYRNSLQIQNKLGITGL